MIIGKKNCTGAQKLGLHTVHFRDFKQAAEALERLGVEITGTKAKVPGPRQSVSPETFLGEDISILKFSFAVRSYRGNSMNIYSLTVKRKINT